MPDLKSPDHNPLQPLSPVSVIEIETVTVNRYLKFQTGETISVPPSESVIQERIVEFNQSDLLHAHLTASFEVDKAKEATKYSVNAGRAFGILGASFMTLAGVAWTETADTLERVAGPSAGALLGYVGANALSGFLSRKERADNQRKLARAEHKLQSIELYLNQNQAKK